MRRAPVADLRATFERDPVEALVEANVIDRAAAKRASRVAERTGAAAIVVIHELALADDNLVADTLATAFELPRATWLDLAMASVEMEGVSVGYLRSKRVLPLRAENDGAIAVGIVDPSQKEGIAAIAFATARKPRLLILSYSEWRTAFERCYGRDEQPKEETKGGASEDAVWAEDAARVRDLDEAAPAVRIVDSILESALDLGASDIHIEPLPDRLRIRLRIDGELKVVAEEPPHLAGSVAARIKILANMDVADRRTPQDGRTSLAAKGRPVDVRISTVPSSYGETVALRLLRRDPGLLDLATLGFSRSIVELLERVLTRRRGLFLVTGPTGSGKTTTLYAMLERLRAEPLKILSIEDPIEYFFPEITQVQVNDEAGVSFASALRSFLRQDPDVILVGEIRDTETARIAIQAALTGHLVLATLHTNDAPGAVARLVDMGIDRYLVGATLTAVVAQRLARRLCEHCRRARKPSVNDAALLHGFGLARGCAAFEATGCARCGGKGVRGRVAVGEGFWIDEGVREAIVDETGMALAATLKALRFRPMLTEAAELASSGKVSLAELRALTLA